MVSFTAKLKLTPNSICMKRNMALLTLLSLGLYVFSQDLQLPEPVKASFEGKYAKARHLEWYMDDEKYILEFEIASNSYTAIYEKDGKWLETGLVISDFDIPVPVTNSMKQKCPASNISYTEKVERSNGEIFYRIHCFNKESDYLLSIAPEGKIVGFEQLETNKIIDDELIEEEDGLPQE